MPKPNQKKPLQDEVRLRGLFRKGALVCGLTLVPTASALAQQNAPVKCPPVARVDSVKDKYGATEVADPYRWLEDQETPETRAWIAAEQKCTEAALGLLPNRGQISKRIAELLHRDNYEPPIERNGRYFFRKRPADGDLSMVYLKTNQETQPEVLIDPNPWSADHSASVALENVSKDGRFVFYGSRDGGQDEITVQVLDLDSHKTLPDKFSKALYFSVEPTPDNKGVYYTRVEKDGPRAFYHEMGSDPGKDKLIFGKDLGKDKILAVGISDDGGFLVYLVVYGSGSEQTEVYLQDLRENGPVVPMATGEKALFFPTFAGDRLLIQTNSNAPRGRVYSAKLAAPQRENWHEVIPQSDANLEQIASSGGKIIAQYTRNAASELKMFDAEGKSPAALPLPSLGSVSGLSGRWESPELFFKFESYSTPASVYRYHVKQASLSKWAGSGNPGEGFQVEQVWFTSKDKTRVPMFLYHNKEIQQDGNSPVLMTGYGGFDVSETPFYWVLGQYWVEQGGIFADVNLRGGAEFGEDWHRAGMLGKKQNVFDDFAAAAEFLIQQRYTNPKKLAITGTSNGGLLMGASLTQRPELFRAVVCGYPLLDMLRFQKFMDGSYWVPEYGSAENPKQFAYLYKYSPYHNVKDGVKYPAVLLVTGDGDTRVAPLHARKMAARLQAAVANDPGRPILLLYDTKSGHSGGRPVSKQVEENTDILSFLLWQVGATSAERAAH